MWSDDSFLNEIDLYIERKYNFKPEFISCVRNTKSHFKEYIYFYQGIPFLMGVVDLDNFYISELLTFSSSSAIVKCN